MATKTWGKKEHSKVSLWGSRLRQGWGWVLCQSSSNTFGYFHHVCFEVQNDKVEQGLDCIRVSFLSVFLKGLASVAQLQNLATSHPKYTLSLRKSLTHLIPTTHWQFLLWQCGASRYSSESAPDTFSRAQMGLTYPPQEVRALLCPLDSATGSGLLWCAPPGSLCCWPPTPSVSWGRPSAKLLSDLLCVQDGGVTTLKSIGVYLCLPLCSGFQSEALQFQNQTEMARISRSLMVPGSGSSQSRLSVIRPTRNLVVWSLFGFSWSWAWSPLCCWKGVAPERPHRCVLQPSAFCALTVPRVHITCV